MQGPEENPDSANPFSQARLFQPGTRNGTHKGSPFVSGISADMCPVMGLHDTLSHALPTPLAPLAPLGRSRSSV
jgi:hypothetical protein